MRIILNDSQLKKIVDEQQVKQNSKEEFEEFLKKFDSLSINNKLSSPETFLSKLNASPIKLNMFYISTDGYKIGTGSVSAEGYLKGSKIRLDVKPVGDFKTAMVTFSKTL